MVMNEWNLKITAHDQPSTLDKISATFESYWNSHEFVLKCIEAGKNNGIEKPVAEAKVKTNYIR